MKKMNKKGFTIVELVIVIAVIAVLAGVMIPTFTGIVTKANQSAALQEVTSAYKNQLATDLATPETADDVVYNKGALVIKHDNGTLIAVTANGEASVVTEGTPTPTHTCTNGAIAVYVAPTPTV